VWMARRERAEPSVGTRMCLNAMRPILTEINPLLWAWCVLA